MTMSGLVENLTNPALLFFVLGICASQIKNDLRIPETSSKFISIYLLLSIGFKGGHEISHSVMDHEVIGSLFLGLGLASAIPIVAFMILKRKLNPENSGAIAASYGSVSAVTFVTAISFLEFEGKGFDGHMIAVMAFMEVPAIAVGIMLIRLFSNKELKDRPPLSMKEVFKHAVNNAGVLMILGSLVIGYLASDTQAAGIKPFTSDIFKGFLAVFLLDMGIKAGSQLGAMVKNGVFLTTFASIIPFLNGMVALLLASLFTDNVGNMLLFAILGASASYIAVPAAMRQAVPQANPGLYLPMALGITFPINVLVGIPFYYFLIETLI